MIFNHDNFATQISTYEWIFSVIEQKYVYM